ncbi:MAG: carbohydrate kinase, partial [Bacteroidota bacterium]
TANAHGVWLRTPALKLRVDVEQFEPLSTIGAGDSFNAGLIYGLYTSGITKEGLGQISGEEWKLLIEQAVSFSSDVCRSYDNYISHDLARMLRNSREF